MGRQLIFFSLLLALAGYFLTDAFGFDLHFSGSLIWLLVFWLSFAAGLAYFSLFLVPVGWGEGVRLLSGFCQKAVAEAIDWIMRLGTEKKPPDDKKKKEAASPDPLGQLAPSFRLVGAGMVPSHQALALVRNNTFSRAAGPGYVRLQVGEAVAQVIDLRPQLRRQPFIAHTRDGIPLHSQVSVLFQVKQLAGELEEGGLPYPYDPEAVFQVNYAGSIDAQQAYRPWSERVCPEATAQVTGELSCYTLDQLYNMDEEGRPATSLADISQVTLGYLKEIFDPKGIHIKTVSLEPYGLDAGITAQRIQNWQARWQKEMEKLAATSQAEALQAESEARVTTERDFIAEVSSKLHQIQQREGVDLRGVLTLHSLQTIEHAISDDARQAEASGKLLGFLGQLVAFNMEEKPDNGGEDKHGQG